MLRKSLLAAGLLAASAFSVASAAPLGSQTGLEADGSPVMLIKKGDFKCCGGGGGGGGGGFGGPGGFKGGGGGGGKGGGNGSGGGHFWRYGGGAVIIGVGYCAVQSTRCEEAYGEGTRSYWRCMHRAGCADD